VGFAPQHAAHRHLMPHWLIHLGGVGVFVVSFIDASIVPLPLPGSTDLLLLLLTANRGNPWLLGGLAITGSILGGYMTWVAGKKGGEAMLQRYVPARFLKPLSRWVQGRGIIAVGTAAILPPPIPLMPFLVAAGALGVSKRDFLASFSIARVLRYGFLAWLGATYGRRVIRIWSHYLAGWSTPILWVFFSLLIAAVIFGIWKFRRDRMPRSSQVQA
jgi:membrane protein YqaA with SNARE-associated domain